MSGFQLDTSGSVGSVNLPNGTQALAVTWGHLTPFAQGYVEAMFAADLADEDPGVPIGLTALSLGKAFRHLAPATLARIIGDCERVEAVFPGASLTAEDGRRILGHRMAGFPGPLATDDAMRAALPPLTPYLGDDGLIYFLETNP